MRLQLNSVDEVKATAEQRLAWYRNLMAKHYNSKVRHRDFQVEDLVLRKVMGAIKDTSQGKLGPNWERPYRVASWHRKGTYHLETLDGQKLHHLWNTKHLKKYYKQMIDDTPHSQFISFQFNFYYLQFLLSPMAGFLSFKNNFYA